MNLPPSFVKRQQQLLGAESEAFFQALHTPSPVSIRLNPAKLRQPDTELLLPVKDETVPWCRNAWYLKERPVFTLDPAFHAGAYYVQEASSMFIDHILQQLLPNRPLRVLDLCAAPGGKSTLLASALPPGSLLVVNEVIRNRAIVLKENIIKWGQDNIVVTHNDPADFRSLKGCFDLILVDAPCSGEGMFRKDEKAISEWNESNLFLCSERQKRILANIWDCLRPEGYLIYSTCTYNPNENNAILDWILQNYPAKTIKISHSFPGITSISGNAEGYQFYPHKTKGEGFFVGVVQKTTGEEFSEKKLQGKETAIRLPAEIQSLLVHPEQFTPYQQEETIGIIPALHHRFIRLLSQHLRILYKGCELAEINNRKLKYLHSFALYHGLNQNACSCYETSLSQALRYLRKEDIPGSGPTGQWSLVTYRGISLGWGKNLGNRFNNYYPKEWRIRMELEK